jgi:hypothetical protein
MILEHRVYRVFWLKTIVCGRFGEELARLVQIRLAVWSVDRRIFFVNICLTRFVLIFPLFF